MIRALGLRLLDKIVYLYRVNLIDKDERAAYTAVVKEAMAAHDSGGYIAIRDDIARKLKANDVAPLQEVLSLFNEYGLEA